MMQTTGSRRSILAISGAILLGLALNGTAYAGCTDREASATVAAYTRAQRAFELCFVALENGSSARTACRKCRQARDVLRQANRRAKRLTDACAAFGVTAELEQMYRATHRIDEVNYMVRTEILDRCGS